jgi:glutathione S-transferase
VQVDADKVVPERLAETRDERFELRLHATHRSAIVAPLILYDSPASGNAYKARLLLAHLGLPYERRLVDVIDRSNPRDELAKLNPTRRVPTLVLDDGRPLGESAAILWYLGDGTPFVPDDPYARAQVLQWLAFELSDHQPGLTVPRFLIRFSGRREQHAELIAERQKLARRALGVMERHLDGRTFFVGDSMSLADIALYAYTHIAHEGEIDLEPYAAVRGWLDRVAAVPGHVPMDAS